METKDKYQEYREEAEQIEVRSEQVQEILGRPPAWIIRWGSTLIFFVICLLFLLSYFIKYPDVISSRLTLTSEHPPIPVYNQVDAAIEEILVSENEEVTKGTLLMVMDDNPASYNDILDLEKALEEIKELNNAALRNFDLKTMYELGTLQNNYSDFSQNLEDYRFFIRKDPRERKILNLEQRIQHYKELNQVHKNRNIDAEFEEETSLANSEIERILALKKEGLTSDSDVEAAEKVLAVIARNKSVLKTNIEEQIINNSIRIDELNNQIISIRENSSSTRNDKLLNLRESYKKLKTQIAEWKYQFVIESPIDGKVAFTGDWSPGIYVNQKTHFLTLVPKSGDYKGKALLPLQKSGKVKTGQRVNLKLDGYPYRQYGMVNAEVKHVPIIPGEQGYLIEISLPDGLATTYGEELEFKQQMQGRADIITEERSLLERLFDQLLSILKNH